MSKHIVLSQLEIDTALKELPDWSQKGDSLYVNYTFPFFKSVMRCMAEVAPGCNVLNHHPTWTNTYNKLEITLSTHDADDKITELDVKLARFISEVALKYDAKVSK